MSRAEPHPPAAAAHWSQQGERGSMALLKLMAWIATTLGRRIARWVLHPITLYFLLCAPAARRRSLRYLGRALARPAHWLDAYRQIHTFAATVLDRVYFARGELAGFEIRVHGEKPIDNAIAQARGAVLLGAHIGSFEVLHAVGASRPGLRVAMVMYPDNARMVQAVLHAIAPQCQLDVIPIGRANSTLMIRDWLAGGGLAGMLGDRVLAVEGGARGGTRECMFLGRAACFNEGPLRLAQLLRQRVIFMVGLYLGSNRYEVRFEPLADFSEAISDPALREQHLHAALDAYVARLEALCREAPYNWFNFHDFWAEDAPR